VWPQDEVAAHEVVDDEPCDGPRDVPRHPDARRRQSSRRRAARQAMRRATPCRGTRSCSVGEVVDDKR
jgi:hypothetical protein